MILYLLLALHFMKAYPKQDTVRAAAGDSSGAIGAKAQRQYIWDMCTLYGPPSTACGKRELVCYLAVVLCKYLMRYSLCFPVLQIIFESRKWNPQ